MGEHKSTRSTAFRWPLIFGKLLIILDVLLPIGFCRLFVIKPVHALFTGSRMNRTILPIADSGIFCWILHPPLLGFQSFSACLRSSHSRPHEQCEPNRCWLMISLLVIMPFIYSGLVYNPIFWDPGKNQPGFN